jgi:hypothetical protein
VPDSVSRRMAEASPAVIDDLVYHLASKGFKTAAATGRKRRAATNRQLKLSQFWYSS